MEEQKPAESNQLPSIRRLEKALGHEFTDTGLLIQALTHSSYAAENRDAAGDNERLEFLGDAVLELVISHILFHRFGERHREGHLTKMRAYLVNEASLASLAAGLELGDSLRLGRGEERSGGRQKPSLLADAFEAVIGALYLDGGLERVFELVERLFEERILRAETQGMCFDYKTALQEYTQARFHAVPEYQLENVRGPAHQRTFEISLLFNGKQLAKGVGKSKKEAEQNAAKQAMESLKKQ